jgi:molybdate transport system ATP-binding protein
MTLRGDVQISLGTLDLRVDLVVPPDEPVAVLGPNGAGKTTMLRALAGLVPLDAGRVTLGTDLLEDTRMGVRMPPERRRIGVVFSDARLFPHLTARDNVAFGLMSTGRPRRDARASADEWLDRVGLPHVASARPDELSAGQAQRVALARALAPEPRALLLDEPMSSLDAEAREVVSRTLRTHLRSFAGPSVIVTHDPLEAVTLADHVVIVEAGRVTQAGPVGEVTRRPRSEWAARLVGMNLLRGTAEGNDIHLPSGGRLVAAHPRSGEVFAVIDPGAVALYRDEPIGSPRNVWHATIAGVERVGDRVRISLGGDVPIVAAVTPAAVADLDLAAGGTVWVAVKATEVETFPA